MLDKIQMCIDLWFIQLNFFAFTQGIPQGSSICTKKCGWLINSFPHDVYKLQCCNISAASTVIWQHTHVSLYNLVDQFLG
jgi:hypothetical protein